MEARSSGKGILPGADGRVWVFRWGLEVDPKGAVKLSGRRRDRRVLGNSFGRPTS